MSFSAETILRQLGGNKFIAMTGSKNFVKGHTYLQFRIPRNKSKANIVLIRLNERDLYDVEFKRLRNYEVDIMQEYRDVDAVSLRDVFTRTTGFAISL